uniref:Prefoldin subunit 4 n=3 Tax=Corvus TaxID=30420 RepID=A0A8C3D769_CORMO
HPIPSHPIPPHPIPSHPTPSHSIPSHPIPSHPIPSHPIPPHPIPSHPIPSHPIPSHPIPSHPIPVSWRPLAAPPPRSGRTSHRAVPSAAGVASSSFRAPRPLGASRRAESDEKRENPRFEQICDLFLNFFLVFFLFPLSAAPPLRGGRMVQPDGDNMAATMKKAAAEDVNVTFEDQQKINKFARNTSRITELKEEIEVKKKQLQNLEDACDDIMLLDDDDSHLIPYQIGDVFISHSLEETQEMLEEAKRSLQEEIEALESRVESIQRVLSDLKVQLYAKFGNNINLEAEDS